MPKRISPTELAAIIKTVAGFPAGISIDELHGALTGSVARRTLQRHLAMLVGQKRLVIEGRGRASRYRLPGIVAQGHGNMPPMTGSGEIYVPISPAGEEIKQAIRQPIQNRRPVGYNRAFLDSYRPNHTFYLSSEIRQRLNEMGRSPGERHPAGTYARQVFNRLLIDLSWNSSRLEGNTYSLLETERLLQLGEAAEGRNAREAQMILNHKAAIELLVEQAAETGLNRYTILNLHGLLSDNLLADPQACGRLRAIQVGITGTVFLPLAVPQLIEECFEQILATGTEIADPFEQAFFVMVHLPYLQPFEDVNKRVSRLAANIPLIRRNFSPLSFVDVPDQAYLEGTLAVYELNRVELLRDVFVWAYQRSCARYAAVRQSLGDPDPFRMKYRLKIGEYVAKAVRNRLDKRAATNWIAAMATEIPDADRARFIELVETELSSLHEGNIARNRLLPNEYKTWKENWH